MVSRSTLPKQRIVEEERGGLLIVLFGVESWHSKRLRTDDDVEWLSLEASERKNLCFRAPPNYRRCFK